MGTDRPLCTSGGIKCGGLTIVYFRGLSNVVD